MTHYAQNVREDQFALAQLRKRPVGGGSSEPKPAELSKFRIDFTDDIKIDQEKGVIYNSISAHSLNGIEKPKDFEQTILKNTGVPETKKDNAIIVSTPGTNANIISKALAKISITPKVDDSKSVGTTRNFSSSVSVGKKLTWSNDLHPVLKISKDKNKNNILVVSFNTNDTKTKYVFVDTNTEYIGTNNNRINADDSF